MRKPKLKALISVLLTVILLLAYQVNPQTALALSSGNYEYTVSGSNATITKYTGSETNVAIPAEIDG
jgi:hypothetical protein